MSRGGTGHRKQPLISYSWTLLAVKAVARGGYRGGRKKAGAMGRGWQQGGIGGPLQAWPFPPTLWGHRETLCPCFLVRWKPRRRGQTTLRARASGCHVAPDGSPLILSDQSWRGTGGDLGEPQSQQTLAFKPVVLLPVRWARWASPFTSGPQVSNL